MTDAVVLGHSFITRLSENSLTIMCKRKKINSQHEYRTRSSTAIVKHLIAEPQITVGLQVCNVPPDFFFSSHYTTPAQCWAQDLAQGLNSSRSSWVHGCGRIGQTSRCFMFCSSPHSHVVCPSSLNPHFCIRDLHRPVPVQRRLGLTRWAMSHLNLEVVIPWD